jgi:acyl-homoserine lactone acylase PvdQ
MKNLLQAYADGVNAYALNSPDRRGFEFVDPGSHMKTAVTNALADPYAPWWDDVNTSDIRETREQIIRLALFDAVNDLKSRLGSDVKQWQWGKLHTVVFPNQTLGKSGHTYHPHYDDMIALWLNGQHNPLLWARADVEKNAEGKLMLTP